MSDEKNEGGSIIPGTIGAIAGGSLAYKGASSMVKNRGIRAVLENSDKATDKFKTVVDGILDAPKNAEITTLNNEFGQLKHHMTDAHAPLVKKVNFTANATGGTHTMELLGDADQVLAKVSKVGGKLPDGFTAGVTDDAAKIKGLLVGENGAAAGAKGILAKSEKSLVGAIKTEGGRFMGIKNAGGWGRTGIIGSAVAGIVVGAMALSAMFGGGGKHTSRVADERANEPAAGAARA